VKGEKILMKKNLNKTWNLMGEHIRGTYKWKAAKVLLAKI